MQFERLDRSVDTGGPSRTAGPWIRRAEYRCKVLSSSVIRLQVDEVLGGDVIDWLEAMSLQTTFLGAR